MAYPYQCDRKFNLIRSDSYYYIGQTGRNEK
jgi:hypothetical protein